MSREDWYLHKMFEKKQRRMSHKSGWKEKLRLMHTRFDEGIEAHTPGIDIFLHPDLPPIHEDTSYGDMTYDKFVELVNQPHEDVAARVGEPSLVDVYEKLLKGQYDWAPKNLTLPAQQRPSWTSSWSVASSSTCGPCAWLCGRIGA